MKKSLLALAVLGSFAGVAAAQSSVTLYGVADLSLSKSKGTSAQMSGNGLLNNGNSRLGVRGVEDLGGGLKIAFNFEQGINIESGATEAVTFQRNAFAELQGGFGSLRYGRSLSPGFYSIASYELTGAANYSAEANMFGFTGGTRENSAWTYTSPNMGGFSMKFGHVLKQDNGGNGKSNLTGTYAAGPLVVSGAWSKQSGGERSISFGGAYNFGAFKVAASYQDPAGAIKGFTLGGSASFGQGGVTVDVARDTGSAVKSTDYVVEGTYALSKRTFSYAAMHRDGSAKATTYGVGIRHNF